MNATCCGYRLLTILYVNLINIREYCLRLLSLKFQNLAKNMHITLNQGISLSCGFESAVGCV